MKSARTAWVALAAVLCAAAFIAASVPRDGIFNGLLQSDLDGNQQCITNLLCLEVGNITANSADITNLSSVTINATTVNATTVNATTVNSTTVNATSLNATNINTTTINNLPVTNLTVVSADTAIRDGYTMLPAATGSSNLYWMDCGRTNAKGQTLIYATLLATNNSRFIGPTNAGLWSLLSFDVFAVGSQTLFFPTNAFLATNGANLLTTNGMTLSNSWYSMVLTNGSLLRFTMQSNPAGWEPTWQVKP